MFSHFKFSSAANGNHPTAQLLCLLSSILNNGKHLIFSFSSRIYVFFGAFLLFWGRKILFSSHSVGLRQEERRQEKVKDYGVTSCVVSECE